MRTAWNTSRKHNIAYLESGTDCIQRQQCDGDGMRCVPPDTLRNSAPFRTDARSSPGARHETSGEVRRYHLGQTDRLLSKPAKAIATVGV